MKNKYWAVGVSMLMLLLTSCDTMRTIAGQVLVGIVEAKIGAYSQPLAAPTTSKPALLWLAYDASMLTPARELGRTRDMVVVLNPNEGSGTKRDSAFASFAAKATGRTRVVGYIDLVTWHGSSWSIKSTANITSEVAAWKNLYGIESFWLDDAFADQNSIRTLVQSVRWKNPTKTFINPGEPVKSGHWLNTTGMIICDHENPTSYAGWKKAKGPCMILFTTAGSWSRDFDAAATKGARYIGLEDKSKHQDGEFQAPMEWWKALR